MKCSLKDGFINILLIILITPSEGIEFPLFLDTSSVLEKPMNFQQLRAAINRLQDLDSFPDDGNSENKLHKIVKKQMAFSDYGSEKKNKRSVFNFPGSMSFGAGDGADFDGKANGKSKKAISSFVLLEPNQYYNQKIDNRISEEILGKIKDFAKDKQLYFSKRVKKKILPNKKKQNSPEKKDEKVPVDVGPPVEETKQKVATQPKTPPAKLGSDHPPVKAPSDADVGKVAPKKEPEVLKPETPPKHEMEHKKLKENRCLCTKCTKIPDENDFRYYYECEASAIGCIKLKHKRCPDGQFFSFRYLKCIKGQDHAHEKKEHRNKRFSGSPYTKMDQLDPTPEEPEPANEWMDASQGVSQKVPPEFKPKKAPGLKIYHLSVKRRLNELLGRTIEKRHILGKEGTPTESYTNLMDKTKGTVKRHNILRHHPRSFLIRINKKPGKDNQDQSITENDDNDNDEEDEESDEEDDDDEGDYDEEETDEETVENKENEKSTHKESLKDLFRSAKMAVTNRARFTDKSPDEASASQKSSSSSKSKKSEESQDSTNKSKKVLIDANIKVDSTISNALKYILKSKNKGKDMESGFIAEDESLISDRGSQDQLDPELMRMYEHLIRNNPRVKRYFLSNVATNED